VLGQHLAGGKQAVFAQLALGHDAFALAEQVGQDAGVGDGISFAVSVTMKRTVRPSWRLQAALLDQAADAEGLALRRLAGGDLRSA
jgi:hypothetical protein